MLQRSWIFVIALSIGPAVSNGFARFGYGLVLPAMQLDLGWSYTMAGWINTANALGYLLGAILALFLIKRIPSAHLFSYGMLLTSLSLFGSALTENIFLLSTMRLLAGIGGAPVFIAGAAMVSNCWPNDNFKNSLAIAIYFGGAGLGILITAVFIPFIIDFYGTDKWPYAWFIMTVFSVAFSVFSVPLILKSEGLTQLSKTKQTNPLPFKDLFFSLAGYFLFAASYVIYMTFVVVWLRDNGAGVNTIAFSWALLGVGVILSPFLWKSPLSKYKSGRPLAMASFATGVGAGIPLIFAGTIGVSISAFIFGLSFFIAPTAVTTFSRKNLPKDQWGASVALYTVVFSIGQALGPIGAGWISDQTGSLTIGLLVGTVVLFLAAGFSLYQKPLR